MTRNDQTVQAIYQAFGRGDVESIVATMSPEVRWEAWADHSAQRAGLDYLAPRIGPEGVRAFFATVARSLEITALEVLDVIGQGRQVVVEVAVQARNVATGRSFRDEEIHLWTFDEAGRVVRLRHYVDTAKHLGAAQRLQAA